MKAFLIASLVLINTSFAAAADTNLVVQALGILSKNKVSATQIEQTKSLLIQSLQSSEDNKKPSQIIEKTRFVLHARSRAPKYSCTLESLPSWVEAAKNDARIACEEVDGSNCEPLGASASGWIVTSPYGSDILRDHRCEVNFKYRAYFR